MSTLFRGSIKISSSYKSNSVKLINSNLLDAYKSWRLISKYSDTKQALIAKRAIFQSTKIENPYTKRDDFLLLPKRNVAAVFSLETPLYIEFIKLPLDRNTSSISQHEKTIILKFVRQYSEPPLSKQTVIEMEKVHSLFIPLSDKENFDFFLAFKNEWQLFSMVHNNLVNENNNKGFSDSILAKIFAEHQRNVSLLIHPETKGFHISKEEFEKTHKDKGYESKPLIVFEPQTLLDLCYAELAFNHASSINARACNVCGTYFIGKDKKQSACNACIEEYGSDLMKIQRKVYELKNAARIRERNRIRKQKERNRKKKQKLNQQ